MGRSKWTPQATPGDPTVRWIEHEFRVQARAAGLLTIRTGVEEFFGDREGARRIITGEFSWPHLFLRSMPDMAVRSPSGTYLIEAKSAASNTDNVAVELWQLLFFRRLGGLVWYLFGWPDATGRILHARLALAKNIRPQRIIVPSRVHSWPEELRSMLRHWLRDEGWGSIVEVRDRVEGSNDPFALFPKSHLSTMVPLDEWITQYGAGGYPPDAKQIRIDWEGRDGAASTWQSVPLQRMRRVGW